MNYIGYHIHESRPKLAARNEGKIKSFESCVDIRAWSHDIRTRGRYLRDWMKFDMPICVVPVCTLASILTIMTCRSRGKISSRRCHQACQSNLLLESISSSCSAMKGCLRNNGDFEKYFKEEEFETIHWPCARYLEILKSIKMFWKIVVEKVMRIPIPKSNEFHTVRKHKSVHSIINVAKEWQKEMVHDAIFVNSNTFLLNQIGQKNESKKSLENNEEKAAIYVDCENKATETECEFRSIAIQKDCKSKCQKLRKCTSNCMKIDNVECDARNDDEVMMIYENNIQHLQQQFNLQQCEVERLKKENIQLNFELQRFCNNRKSNLSHNENSFDNIVALAPSVFENSSGQEADCNPAKKIDSEIIITLKNWKHKNFRHVSMLQVLHKTNEKDIIETNSSNNKEDPVYLLNKVQEKFDAMVSREIDISNESNKNSNNKDITVKTTFRRFRDCRFSPSNSTSSSYSLTSGSHFESAKETYESSIKSGKFD